MSADDGGEVVVDAAAKDVLIICTGGTISMFEDSVGALAPSKGFLPTFLPKVLQFNQERMPSWDMIEWDPLIDSANMNPTLWTLLTEQIRENYDKYRGFVVLMGTDTMSYTSSAISFAFENLSKPIVFTGSQIPLCRAFTDARRNLTIAILAAANVDVPEVCVFFGDKLFRANRTKKMDNWGNKAFESPNCEALATCGVNVQLTDRIRPAPEAPLKVHSAFYSKILVVWLVPGFDDQILLRLARPETDEAFGIILMLYGSGNGPQGERQWFQQALMELKASGAEICVASQCRKGSINLAAYATGAQLRGLGLINGVDMTIEACVTKMSALMGRGYRGDTLKSAMEKDLCGELTETPHNVPYHGIDGV